MFLYILSRANLISEARVSNNMVVEFLSRTSLDLVRLSSTSTQPVYKFMPGSNALAVGMSTGGVLSTSKSLPLGKNCG